MTAEIKKLNKLLEKLEKNIAFIKTGAILDGCSMHPLKVISILKYKQKDMYLMRIEELDDYLVFDLKSFDKALARKEVIK